MISTYLTMFYFYFTSYEMFEFVIFGNKVHSYPLLPQYSSYVSLYTGQCICNNEWGSAYSLLQSQAKYLGIPLEWPP